ncbi:MAG: hypothetical protein K0S33_1220 [Bacteroidetes bacterium]|jgi:hypothetical protein|nr:hypothetical protein [Bacteroidota bacterium]
MTKEEAIIELKAYKKYELKKLKLKDSEDEYETVEQVFVGPQSAATFREFYKIFVKGDKSPTIINFFSGSNMAIYFLIGSGDESDPSCISLDLFLQTYETD